MNKYFFSFIFSIMLSAPVFGCLNGEQMVLANKELLYVDHSGEVPYGHGFGSKEQVEEFLGKLEKGYQETKDLDYLSDKGFILIILGKYNESIELYKKIESMQPGRYSTASNIGTAYELIGNNKEALKWIEKAIEIEPNSHFRSEWIHVNILKTKIKGDQYISSEHLIGKDFGKEKYPKSDLNKDELQLLKMQLYYQLNERISFVKPKDKIVAQLLFDLGNLAFLTNQKEDAMEDYEMAKEYGFESPVLNERLQAVGGNKQKILNSTEKNEVHWIGLILSIVSLVVSGCILFIYRKKILLLLK